MPTTITSPARNRSALAARRARIRHTGQTIPPLDARRWAAVLKAWDVYPDPTDPIVMWGVEEDAGLCPVILELANPAAGTMLVMADAGNENLMAAILLSLAWLNLPEVATAHIVTPRPALWQWAQRIPHLDGISRPGDGGLQDALRRAYRDDRYLLVLADGDEATQALPPRLLQDGPPNGLWPLIFCSPTVGVQIASSGIPYTPIQGYVRSPLTTADTPPRLLLPGADLRPGQSWTTRVRGRLVRFTLPTATR